jgi:hypothetical protein
VEPDGDSWLLEEPLDAPEPPMLEPDWVCAKAENARSAAAVAVQRIFSFMEMFLLRWVGLRCSLRKQRAVSRALARERRGSGTSERPLLPLDRARTTAPGLRRSPIQ